MLPSVVLSQKQELAVCRPAPFFCIITQVTENTVNSINIYTRRNPKLSNQTNKIAVFLKNLYLQFILHSSFN